jgi:hypothetical protein
LKRDNESSGAIKPARLSAAQELLLEDNAVFLTRAANINVEVVVAS